MERRPFGVSVHMRRTPTLIGNDGQLLTPLTAAQMQQLVMDSFKLSHMMNFSMTLHHINLMENPMRILTRRARGEGAGMDEGAYAPTSPSHAPPPIYLDDDKSEDS
jgi:hypothetical protein